MLPSTLPLTAAATVAPDTLAQCSHTDGLLTSDPTNGDISSLQYGMGYGLEPGSPEYEALYEGALEEAKKKLGVAVVGEGRCREGGFPRFQPAGLPVVVHVAQYVDSR